MISPSAAVRLDVADRNDGDVVVDRVVAVRTGDAEFFIPDRYGDFRVDLQLNRIVVDEGRRDVELDAGAFELGALGNCAVGDGVFLIRQVFAGAHAGLHAEIGDDVRGGENPGVRTGGEPAERGLKSRSALARLAERDGEEIETGTLPGGRLLGRAVQRIAVRAGGVRPGVEMSVLEFHVPLFALLGGNFDDLRFHKHLRERNVERKQCCLDGRHLVAQDVDDDGVLVRGSLAGSALGERGLDGVLRGIRVHETETVDDHRTFRSLRILVLHIGNHQIRFIRDIPFRSDDGTGAVFEQSLQPLDDSLLAASGEPCGNLLLLNLLLFGSACLRTLLRRKRTHSDRQSRRQNQRQQSGIFYGQHYKSLSYSAICRFYGGL